MCFKLAEIETFLFFFKNAYPIVDYLIQVFINAYFDDIGQHFYNFMWLISWSYL